MSVTKTAPQGLLVERPMQGMQFVVVAICCLTNVTDGIDIATLAYAAPVLIADWGLRPAILGMLFGATAAGLAIGAFFVSQLGDRFGHQRITLIATGMIAVAMLGTALANSVMQLAVLRFITGLCLGTLAVCLNVMVSEFTNSKWRNLSVAALHSGFSIGTMSGGILAALLLEPYGWRAMFVASCVANVVAFLLLLFFVPESPSYVVARGGANALERLNRVLARIGQAPAQALPAATVARGKAKVNELLGSARRNSTLLLWLSQFAFAMVSYLLLNWKPTVLVAAGLTPAEAGWAGFASGIAGVAGHMLAGYMSRNGREARATIFFFGLLCISLLWFGFQPPVVWGLIIAAAFTSFCNVGVFTGLLLIAINYYPAAVRTASVSMLVGIARLGAIAGPLFGGLLLEMGLTRLSMFIVLAGVALVPLVAIFLAMRGWKRNPMEVAPA